MAKKGKKYQEAASKVAEVAKEAVHASWNAGRMFTLNLAATILLLSNRLEGDTTVPPSKINHVLACAGLNIATEYGFYYLVKALRDKEILGPGTAAFKPNCMSATRFGLQAGLISLVLTEKTTVSTSTP